MYEDKQKQSNLRISEGTSKEREMTKRDSYVCEMFRILLWQKYFRKSLHQWWRKSSKVGVLCEFVKGGSQF